MEGAKRPIIDAPVVTLISANEAGRIFLLRDRATPLAAAEGHFMRRASWRVRLVCAPTSVRYSAANQCPLVAQSE